MGPSGQPPADVGDERTYEPRPASERALRGLATWLDGRVDTAVVAGAPGAGTTYVLRRLGARERGRRAVLFSPFLHIEAERLEAWLGGLARTAGFASLDAWLAPAPRAPLLLVDEAHTAAPGVLDALARLRAARAPQLQICLGGCAGPALERAAQRMAGSGLLVLELPPWSAEDLRGLANALCAVAPVDTAALVAGAEESPGLLRLAWTELRDRPPPAGAAPAPTPAAEVTRAVPPAPAAPLIRAPAPAPAVDVAHPVAPARPAEITRFARPAPAAEVARVTPPARAEVAGTVAPPAPVEITPTFTARPAARVARVTPAGPASGVARVTPPAPAAAVVRTAPPAPAAEDARTAAPAPAEPVARTVAPAPPAQVARVAPPEELAPAAAPARAAAAEPPLAPEAPPQPPAPRERAVAPAPLRRRARVPWFHAAALVVGFVLGLAGGWQGWEDEEVAPAPELPPLAAVEAAPPVVPVAAASRQDVQVNARPWAWIRIDGQAVGVTPLVQRGLAEGPHEFEATFPDGRQARRTVEIGPDSRFVSFAD
jgi:hypothetical protein